MSRYDEQLTAIILKKQPLGEADVLVTWYTRERGKVRTLVRAARRPQSRLAFLLHEGTVVSMRLVGRSEHTMPILAGGSVVATHIREPGEHQAVLMAWLSEVLLKATPDNETNEFLFAAAESFLRILPTAQGAVGQASLVGRTLLQVLDALGVAVHEEAHVPAYFSVQGGGFFMKTEQVDAVPVSAELWQQYQVLKAELAAHSAEYQASIPQLVSLLNSFLEYHIERPIRSFAFVSDILNAEH
jgi:DNA repair protein RecO (recombination protein O)